MKLSFRHHRVEHLIARPRRHLVDLLDGKRDADGDRRRRLCAQIPEHHVVVAGAVAEPAPLPVEREQRHQQNARAHHRPFGIRLHDAERSGEQRIARSPRMEGERTAPPLHPRQGERVAAASKPVHARPRIELVFERPIAGHDAGSWQPEASQQPVGNRLCGRAAQRRRRGPPLPTLHRSQGGFAPDERLGGGQC